MESRPPVVSSDDAAARSAREQSLRIAGQSRAAAGRARMNKTWDQECDVLVVGTGAGGMTAALRARDLGLDVLLVEKSDRYGGTSAISGGGIWIPCNHRIAAIGGQDSAQEAIRYIRTVTEGVVD